MPTRDKLLASLGTAARWIPWMELLLAIAYVAAAGLIVHGVGLLREPAAWIVSGLAVAGFAALFLVEAG